MSNAPKLKLDRLDERLQEAIGAFWNVRESQGERQGTVSGKRDAGSRSNVTGGKHLDPIVNLLEELLSDNAPSVEIHTRRTTLPGYFRPSKSWDLVAMAEDKLVACIELKSQVGSFGNNYNNRIEEVVGASTDIRTAYREGAFEPSPRPWIGYLLILQDCDGSTRTSTTRKMDEPHFPISDSFRDKSYAQKYETSLTRLVREEAYNSACLILSGFDGDTVTCRQPNDEIAFLQFAASLVAHAVGAAAS